MLEKSRDKKKSIVPIQKGKEKNKKGINKKNTSQEKTCLRLKVNLSVAQIRKDK